MSVKRTVPMCAAGVAAAVLFAGGASATSAVAPAVWLPPDEVSSPQESTRLPTVAVSRTGEVLVLYGGATGVEAMWRGPGGNGGAWARLASCGSRSQVRFDSAGNAVAIWQDCATRDTRILASARAPGLNGQWQEPMTLSTLGRSAFEPVLSVNGRGDAIASWAEWADDFEVIQASTRSGSTGAWEPAVQLSSTGAWAYESVSAINEQGDAVVGFTRSDPAGPIVWSAFRPAGGSWLPSVQLSQPGDHGVFPALALDRQGNAIAVWSEDFGGRSSFRLRATGAWETPIPFPSGHWTHVATDSKGNVLAAWEQGSTVWVSDRPAGPGSTWTEAAPVADAPGATAVHVAFDDADDAVVLWASSAPVYPLGSISAAPRAAGSRSWDVPAALEEVRAVRDWVRYAVDRQGNVVAVWEDDAWPRAVRSAVLDAAAPALRVLRVPSKGRAGRTVGASSSFDDISPVKLRWRFGDGTSATGSAPRHAYARPGSYRIRVIATDAAGHRATVSRPIRITR